MAVEAIFSFHFDILLPFKFAWQSIFIFISWCAHFPVFYLIWFPTYDVLFAWRSYALYLFLLLSLTPSNHLFLIIFLQFFRDTLVLYRPLVSISSGILRTSPHLSYPCINFWSIDSITKLSLYVSFLIPSLLVLFYNVRKNLISMVLIRALRL